MSSIRASAVLILLALPAAQPAEAGPVYKDTERFDRASEDRGAEAWHPGRVGRGRAGPPRRIDGGPGYVGSDYGLGKPAFTGLGSRPDWGHSE